VLMLTTFDSDEYVFAALQAGASGFLLKDAPSEQLVSAVRSAAGGDALIDPSITKRLIQEFVHAIRPRSSEVAELSSLTPRERDVLRLVAQGLSNAEIAADLVVEESTIKTHVGRILMKLNLRDRVQAVVLAYESGFIGEFSGRSSPAPINRLLTTVLFTDIVGSTEKAAALGDDRWRTLLDAHDRVVRDQLRRFRGVEINTTGDGFLASFDGPARAVRCGRAIVEATTGLGIKLRTGLHTGECEVRGDNLGGLAVHIAARVSARAGPGEVLVSSTVKDLVVGSGIEFEDRGEQELKGVPGPWRLFAVTS
jgi:class 3 adenylate cyclase